MPAGRNVEVCINSVFSLSPLCSAITSFSWLWTSRLPAAIIEKKLDVHFVSPLPVMQRPACKVWADTRRVQIVWVERSPMLGPDIVDDACD
jgi:hypothetical protein